MTFTLSAPFRLLAITLASVSLSTSVQATPLIASEVLQQFNLVVFGDAKSSSHVDGRTYVGGNLQGGDYVLHVNDMPASAYAGLVVKGNVSGVNVNGGGISVGGNLSSANINQGGAHVAGNAASVNFNGGAAYVGGTASSSNFNQGRLDNPLVQADTTGIETTLRSLSEQLAGMADSGGSVTTNGNKVTFTALADSSGIAVFDLSLIDTTILALGEFEFNLGNAALTVFNVDDDIIDIAANFLGGSALSIGSQVIWNFFNASDITLRNQFGGTVLAPDAHLRNDNNIEGSVIVSTLDQHGEIHLQPFSGPIPDGSTPVPEPGSIALLLCGLGLLRLHSRRRTAN